MLTLWHITKKIEEWDATREGFTFAHNTPKEGENFSPAFLVYGRDLRNPKEIIKEEIGWSTINENILGMILNFRGAWSQIQHYRGRNMGRIQERYNRRRKELILVIRDLVYKHEKMGIGNKLIKRKKKVKQQ